MIMIIFTKKQNKFFEQYITNLYSVVPFITKCVWKWNWAFCLFVSQEQVSLNSN